MVFGWLFGRRDGANDAPAAADPSDDALIEAIVDGMPDAAIVLDREGRVLAFNSAARLIAPALARGAPASLALRVPEVVEAIREVAAAGSPRGVEFAQRVPVDRWFKVHVHPVGATRAMMLLTFHDLTPLHRAEQMRADFVANASHELRTPLASLSGFIETLQGPARDDTGARALPRDHEDAGRAHGAADRRSAVALAHRAVEHMHPGAARSVPVLRQVVDGLQTLATDRGVEIALAPPASPVIVRGDRDELRECSRTWWRTR